nr:ribonuclease H-like domain-containing protein [Tanacetum cinerariifolium]
MVRNEVVRVKIPKYMSWLDAYDEPIGDLDMMEDKVDSPRPQSTPQVLPSFELYTPPMTYSKEVEETLGTPIEVEPLEETHLEDLGLNTCNHDIPLSSREVPIFDELEPQPQPLDTSLRNKRGPEPPIKPPSLDSFRMKYCYYHLCIDDPKKHYGFKPGFLEQSRSLGVDFLNIEMIEDYLKFEPKEVSFFGRRHNLPVKRKEVENESVRMNLKEEAPLLELRDDSDWRPLASYITKPIGMFI